MTSKPTRQYQPGDYGYQRQRDAATLAPLYWALALIAIATIALATLSAAGLNG